MISPEEHNLHTWYARIPCWIAVLGVWTLVGAGVCLIIYLTN